jgi:hypothetical protein
LFSLDFHQGALAIQELDCADSENLTLIEVAPETDNWRRSIESEFLINVLRTWDCVLISSKLLLLASIVGHPDVGVTAPGVVLGVKADEVLTCGEVVRISLIRNLDTTTANTLQLEGLS